MPDRPDLLAPDLILVNGAIHTVDDANPRATAVAIRDGRFVAVGDTEIRDLAGPSTRVEDLGGAAVVPGLIDAHNHLQATGRMLREVQLYDTRAIPEIVARVAARVRETPRGEWVVGRGWDESLLAEGRHPTRHDLDAVSPQNPVVIHRVWNKLVCNSAALRAAGIDRQTPDPPADVLYSGSFERDEAGRADGALPRPGQGPDHRSHPGADRRGACRGGRRRLPRLQRGRADGRRGAGTLPRGDPRLSTARGGRGSSPSAPTC